MKDLELLKNECLDCSKCVVGGRKVHGGKSNVFSNMNLDADIMVVGQNPGADEVKRGEPFVGDSGKVFDKLILETCGLTRKDFYISNAVRCYTPDNRKPYQLEVDNCRSFLDREIKIVEPKLIIGLGGFALKQLTGKTGIMKNHGKVIFSIRYGVDVIPLLHPSPVNTQKEDRMKMLLDDLNQVKIYLENMDV
jgi:DNA polymerase